MTRIVDPNIERQLRNAWRLTPATMANRLFHGQWIPAKHLMYISKIVAAEVAKGNARIIVTMPARHGKSEFLSVNTPIWFLEKWPSKYCMGVSYGVDLATDFSVRVRDTFKNEDYHSLLSTRINTNRGGAARFLTTAGGGMTAAGVGGPITGRGGHLITVDDYFKNAEESLSETVRQKIWDWYLSTLWTRREPGASVIVLATRWHYDDLIGRILVDQAHENWTVINLPALALDNDPLGRAPGEALWPERYDEEELLKIKMTLGTYWWDAMYQQDPRESMAGMELGEQLNFISVADLPHPDHFDKRVRGWDLAATSDDKADFTAGPLMMRHKATGNIYVTDMPWDRWTPNQLEKQIQAAAMRDDRRVETWVEQEPGSAGKIAVNHLRKNVMPTGRMLHAEKPSGPLEVRASPLIAAIEAGKVYVVSTDKDAKLKREWNGFPDGEHDDTVSSMALAYNQINGKPSGGLTWGRDLGDNKELVRTRKAHVNRARQSSVVW